MDYSSISNDPDHPTGASPWENSPRQQRPFSEVPPSPLHSHHQSPYAADREGFGDSQQENGGDQREGAVASDLSGRLQGAHIDDPESTEGQPSHGQGQQQQRTQAPARYQTGARQQARHNVPKYKLQAKVTALERTGKKDPIIRFDVHTNIPKFRTTQFRDVRRTHSEFVKLADHLISNNPEAFVPAVPPPLTPAGAGTDEDEVRIKSSMQRWLHYVCGNDVLMLDEEMVLFIESDFGYSPVVKMKQPATGVRRKVLKQFAPPPDDTPELQDARPVVKHFYLSAMDCSQKVDKVVRARRVLALAESDLGVRIGQMHVQETHPGLANAYKKLGKIIQTAGDYHAAQGTAEATTLGDPLNYHSADALIVKETLTNRHILLRELIHAQQLTRNKFSAAERLKVSSSVRSDKVDEALASYEEAKSHEEYLLKKTQRVTNNLLQEKRRWFNRTSNDLLLSIREYTIREIEVERRTLSTLESVRADIRAIDASGGLSRLGREFHPAARRASLASSQGPKGDAWSGVPRRGDSLNRSISGSFVSPVAEGDDEADGKVGKGRARARSGASIVEEDEDRVDARNAASRLAASTF
ncbi:Vacuolar protein sorting-associated protein 17 [Myotisia sp. PD_48]|nr:Vacuolar protein sorting-associated protein 17 [Myotisia sp. PD_48]